MSVRIRISWAGGEVMATLEDTPSTRALTDALPLESSANTWGDEVYFSVPFSADLENNAKQVVDAGTVCFWVEGNCLALPFGPTPISEGDECRLASACNILGKLESDPVTLSSIRSGHSITVKLQEA